MSRRCQVTGKGVQYGNNVSHANNKTRRRFLPNLQETSIYSEVLKTSVRVRLSTNGLRTIDHKGGLDAWLTGTAPTKLDPKMRRVRARIVKALEARKAAA